jgi:hypothetical protein
VRSFWLPFTLLACLLPSLAPAGDVTIIIWPKVNAAGADYAADVASVKEQATRPVAISLWGWEKLEPAAGKLDVTREDGGLRYALEQGFVPYVGATVIDTTKRVLPSDLATISWTDPALLRRYNALLEALAKRLPASLSYFIIANEADVYLEKHPDEVPEFLAFVTAAKALVKTHFPVARVGVTATFEGYTLGSARGEIAKAILAASDLAYFTYYPVMQMKPTPPAQTPAHLAQMIAAAGNKPVVLQEVGYPSGLSEDGRAQQAEFFNTIIPALAKEPRIELAAIFALHDIDSKGCQGLLGYYGLTNWLGTSPWAESFRKFICSLGLRDENGNPKPAWAAVSQQLQLAREQQN